MATNENTADLSKVIKRLEIIKGLIVLEEESEISAHVARLRQSIKDKDLETIISLLEKKAYSQAMPAIEAFINRHHQVGIYIDLELEGLKLEAKVLEAEVNGLSEEKADLEKLIYEFGVRHNNELGELILKILRFRQKKAKGTPQEAEAEKDYNEYNKEYEITKDEKINELTEEEQKDLKQKYRKASKLCHPDVVSEEQKELADKLFAELNAAYERNDLKRVKEILENLEKGNFFVSKSDAINEKQLLKAEIEKLRMRIKEVKQQVQNIKGSEAYITINSIDDLNEYFENAKQKLTKQIEEMEHGE
jgi:DnaJ domain